MALKDLFYDKTDGEDKLSLSRTTSVATFFILSAGFMLTAWKRASYEVFIAYPAGVILTFVPQLFLRLISKAESVIRVWKGGGEEA